MIIGFIVDITDFIIIIVNKADLVVINIAKDFIAKITEVINFSINIAFVIKDITITIDIHYY